MLSEWKNTTWHKKHNINVTVKFRMDIGFLQNWASCEEIFFSKPIHVHTPKRKKNIIVPDLSPLCYDCNFPGVSWMMPKKLNSETSGFTLMVIIVQNSKIHLRAWLKVTFQDFCFNIHTMLFTSSGKCIQKNYIRIHIYTCIRDTMVNI